jgi:hypothetical protein
VVAVADSADPHGQSCDQESAVSRVDGHMGALCHAGSTFVPVQLEAHPPTGPTIHVPEVSHRFYLSDVPQEEWFSELTLQLRHTPYVNGKSIREIRFRRSMLILIRP